MGRGLLATLFCLGAASAALSGPNAGGTIVAHDASLAYTIDNTISYCGLGSTPSFCEGVDTDLEGSSPSAIAIWKVYAAFWRRTQPNLKGITFGIHYPNGSTGIHILYFGPCSCDPNTGGIETPGIGWPGNDTGNSLVFSNTLTANLNEIYWFAGYTYSAGAANVFQLRDHPDVNLGGNFADDSTPAVLDPINGYGSLGFDTEGTLACPVAPGACCQPNGNCTLTWQIECRAPNVWNGTASCDPDPCPIPPGACCDPATGNCTMTTRSDCLYPDVWMGASVPCSPNPCAQPGGACCDPAIGTCTFTTQAGCLPPDIWKGPNLPCTPNPCPQPPTGACCYSDGHCVFTVQAACSTGNWILNAPCDPNPCPPAGACCDPATGACIYTVQADCLTPDVWHGPNSSCSPNPCPPPPSGACCYVDGRCVYTPLANCHSGDWLIDTPCDPDPCPPAGACCDPNTGACTLTIQATCLAPDSWLGPNTTCKPNPCPAPVNGACCVCGVCTVTTQRLCRGQWLGAGVPCDPNPCAHKEGGHVYAPHSPHIKAAGTVGRGQGVAVSRSRSNPCGGTLLLNYDGSAENAFCWQYGGIVPPLYGAFAECYSYSGSVCGIELDLTSIGNPSDTATLLVWDDACGIPSNVISQVNVNPSGVPLWPSIGTFDYSISANVSGNFWVGYWADFANQGCGYFVAADLNGFGGCPMTNIAPGIGYPTGWNNTSVVWGPTQSLGIGAWVGGSPVPVTETTWGRIKSLYH